jgi:hypothetical protein
MGPRKRTQTTRTNAHTHTEDTRQCQIGPKAEKQTLPALSLAGGKDDWVGERWDYG